MIRSLKITCVFLLVSWLVSCGGRRSTSATALNQTATGEKAIVINEKINIVSDLFGDTLRGAVPLPELGKLPIRYQMSSGGATLDLDITENRLTYQVTPKQTGKTTTNIDRTTQENSSNKIELEMEDVTKTVATPWRPPFWMYITGIGILIAAYYVLKNHLNPF